MEDSSRNIVYVDSDLFDLVSVLIESLSSELVEIVSGFDDGDYSFMREKVHSSKGAALTFGFGVYAEELENLRQAVLDQDDARIRQSIDKLKALLERAVFSPAG
ncbi:Hpt domain-containing protein [Maridesulfovibrio sp.]|uniref:Hpt domain-containing protein n=1 Tax=Maridesulfovibrio sp. TaxID=2795000 RepID=UPI003BAA1C87